MDINDNVYMEINNSIDVNNLIDLFFEQINTKTPIDALPVCVKIYNRINRMKVNLDDNIILMQLEMRNLYVLCLSQFYQAKMELKQDRDLDFEDLNNKLFLGFKILSSNNENEEEVKDFAARTMLKDILNDSFPNNRFNIEEDIHRKYNSKELVLSKGVCNIVADIINSYDPNLGEYLLCHIYLLSDYDFKFDYYLFNFEEFEYKNEKNRFYYMEEEVKDYCDDNDVDFNNYFYRVLNNKKILDKYFEYSFKYNSSSDELNDISINANNTSLDFNYINISKIVDKYLKERMRCVYCCM